MKTKAFIKFLANTAHLEVDLEVVDVVFAAALGGRMHTLGSDKIFDHVDGQKHPRLHQRNSTDHSRKLALNHLKGTVNASFLKKIYEDLTVYFRDTLSAAADYGLDSARLIGEHKISLDANRLLSCKDHQEVISLIASDLFRKLEGVRSTKDLINKLSKKLGLVIDDSIIDAALPYFEIRHLLVHNSGKADESFVQDFPEFGFTVGSKIPLNVRLISRARIAVGELVKEFDKAVVEARVVDLNT